MVAKEHHPGRPDGTSSEPGTDQLSEAAPGLCDLTDEGGVTLPTVA